MDYEKFAASVDELVPEHKPEAAPLWLYFASECVESEQYVHFQHMADKTAAEGKWLDVFYAGFCAVKESFGQDTATAVVDLSCEHCCLYPGEMMQVAVLLDNGSDAKDIMEQIEAGIIDPPDLFSPIPWVEALGIEEPDKEPDTFVPRHSVLKRLNHLENDSSSVKREVTKERGAER